MWTVKFWKAAAERALKTFAQTALSAYGVGATNVLSVGWKQVLLLAGSATVLSLLTSLGSAKVAGDLNSPSLVAGEKT